MNRSLRVLRRVTGFVAGGFGSVWISARGVVDTLGLAGLPDDAKAAGGMGEKVILWLAGTGPWGAYGFGLLLLCFGLFTFAYQSASSVDGKVIPRASGRSPAPETIGNRETDAASRTAAGASDDENQNASSNTPEQNRTKQVLMDFVRRHVIEAFRLQDNVIRYYIHNYIHRVEPRELRPFMQDGFKMNFHLMQEVALLAKARKPAGFFATDLSDLESMLVETKSVYNTRSEKLDFFTMMRNRGEFVLEYPEYLDDAIRSWHVEHDRMSAMWNRVARDGGLERLFDEARTGVPWRKTGAN